MNEKCIGSLSFLEALLGYIRVLETPSFIMHSLGSGCPNKAVGHIRDPDMVWT